MPRPLSGPTPQSERTTIRHTIAFGKLMDRLRGPLTRSDYLRHLVMRDEQNRKARSHD